jgi:hypothetical protein
MGFEPMTLFLEKDEEEETKTQTYEDDALG